MRILFSFAGGSGHLNPLLPIATAARGGGHTIGFIGEHQQRARVEAAGFTMFATGTPSTSPPPRVPLQPPDQAREERVIRDAYADRLARRRAAGIIALAPAWQPDLIVADDMDFGAMIGAEVLGLPHAEVIVIVAGGFARQDVVGDRLDVVRSAFGLLPDPGFAMPGRHLVIEPAPPGFRTLDDPLPPTALAIRPAGPGAGAPAASPVSLPDDPARPLIYFTLGTIFNVESGDLFNRVLGGLHALPVNVVVTVGNGIDPAELGPQPAHIQVNQYIPQDAILPHCTAVISHGGSGSVIGALMEGLPQVLIPLGADQLLNGERATSLGFGIVLGAVTLRPDDAGRAVREVLANPLYRQRARALRDATRALPGPEEAVQAFERLVAMSGVR